MVTFLSGGTGTPKVLWGSGDVFPRERTTVIANTGDDIDLGGLHVSPDVDTVLFEQAGLLDRERWWGIDNDPTVTHEEIDRLATAMGIEKGFGYLPKHAQTTGRPLSHWRRFAGVPEFMIIGDRDRAIHAVRSSLLDDGHTLTDVTQQLAQAHGISIDLLPMSDDPVATLIHTTEGLLHFQEYWVGRRAEPSVNEVEFRGASSAEMTPSVKRALAEPVIIGPSNPVTSLEPMLAIPGFSEALSKTRVVAVSPFIENTVFSGPAADLMQGTGREPSTRGFADLLPMVDAFVLDSTDHTSLDRPVVQTNTRIESRSDAERVAVACATALEDIS